MLFVCSTVTLASTSKSYKSGYDTVIAVGYATTYRSDAGFSVSCSSTAGTITQLAESYYDYSINPPYGSFSRVCVYKITNCANATITITANTQDRPGAQAVFIGIG